MLMGPWVGLLLALVLVLVLVLVLAVKALLHPIFLGGSQNWRPHRQFWWGVRLILILMLLFAIDVGF